MNPSELAKAMQALRKNRRGGRPKKLKRCPTCHQKLGARELRAHTPTCK